MVRYKNYKNFIYATTLLITLALIALLVGVRNGSIVIGEVPPNQSMPHLPAANMANK